MAWEPIINGDEGNFETTKGSDETYYDLWDLDPVSSNSANNTPIQLTSESTRAFKDQRALLAFYINPNTRNIIQEIVKGFKFQATINKHYAIRLYAYVDYPNYNNANTLTFKISPNTGSPANPTTTNSSSQRYEDINNNAFNKFFQLVKARDSGLLIFDFIDDLREFATGALSAKSAQGEVYLDQVEFFEHDLLNITENPTQPTFKGANDGIAEITIGGGSGSFLIIWRFKAPGATTSQFFFQETVAEADENRTFTLEALEPGTYEYYVTDTELAYVIEEEIVITQPNSTLALVVNKTNVSSAGLEDGSISLSATGDSETYTFDISPKLGNQVSASERDALPPGTYTGKVTDTVNGEVRTQQIIINEPGSNLTLSLTKKDVTIPGIANGEITANAFGDTGDYAFSILPNTAQQQANVFTGLVAGVYDVTVTDLNSDGTVTEQIEILEPAGLTITEDRKVNNLCFENSLGEVDITIDGGTSPYTYLWNNGTTTKNRLGLSTGNHIVRVTDSLNYSKEFTIIITSPPRLVVNIIKTGQDVVVQATGGVAPYTYLWSDGSTVATRTLAIGNYVVAITDANGCTKSATVEISEFKFYFSKNPIWLQKTTDPDEKLNLSYDAVLKIEDDYNSGIYNTIIEVNHPALIDGSTVFDFQEILKAKVKVALPAFNGVDPYLMASNFRRFYVEINERYGSPSAAQSATTSETFHVINGGLSQEVFADGEFFSSFLENNLTPFFSWEPVAKAVYKDQPEWLAFPIIKSTNNNIKLQVQYFNQANELIGTLLQDAIAGLQPFMLVNFPVGFSQLGLNTISLSADIAYYQVQLLNSNNQAISEQKVYYISIQANKPKYYIYENSLGVWATLVADGESTGQLQVNMDMVKVPKLIAYNASQRGEQSINKSLIQVFSYMAGNYLPQDAYFLADFVNSEEVYEITNKRFRPVNISIDSDWFNTFEDSSPFEFSVRYEADKNWTPDVFRLNNRKIVASELAPEAPTVFSDFGFEGTYGSWGLPSLNNDRITRVSTPSNNGSGAARFKMAQVINFKNEAGQELIPAFSIKAQMMIFDISKLIVANKKNIISFWSKTNGVSTGKTERITTRIVRKTDEEQQFTPFFNSVLSTQATVDTDSPSFTNNWKQNKIEYSIGAVDVNFKYSAVLLIDSYFPSLSKFNNLEVYIDDFSVTYENL